VDTTDIFHRDRKSFERVVFAQELFVDVWEEVEVFKRFEIVGVNSVAVVELFIGRYVVVGVVQRPAQTFVLKFFNLCTTVQFLGVELTPISGRGRWGPRLRNFIGEGCNTLSRHELSFMCLVSLT
jgi:hypothetical protein